MQMKKCKCYVCNHKALVCDCLVNKRLPYYFILKKKKKNYLYWFIGSGKARTLETASFCWWTAQRGCLRWRMRRKTKVSSSFASRYHSQGLKRSFFLSQILKSCLCHVSCGWKYLCPKSSGIQCDLLDYVNLCILR